MTENLSEKIIGEKETRRVDRLPIEVRNPFQKFIFNKLNIGDDDVEKVLKDGKLISDYIDNPKNVEVRELIVQKEFEKAAEILIAELEKREDWPKAA